MSVFYMTLPVKNQVFKALTIHMYLYMVQADFYMCFSEGKVLS